MIARLLTYGKRLANSLVLGLLFLLFLIPAAIVSALVGGDMPAFHHGVMLLASGTALGFFCVEDDPRTGQPGTSPGRLTVAFVVACAAGLLAAGVVATVGALVLNFPKGPDQVSVSGAINLGMGALAFALVGCWYAKTWRFALAFVVLTLPLVPLGIWMALQHESILKGALPLVTVPGALAVALVLVSPKPQADPQPQPQPQPQPEPEPAPVPDYSPQTPAADPTPHTAPLQRRTPKPPADPYPPTVDPKDWEA